VELYRFNLTRPAFSAAGAGRVNLLGYNDTRKPIEEVLLVREVGDG